MQELTSSNIAERLDLLTEVSVALGDAQAIGGFLDRIHMVDTRFEALTARDRPYKKGKTLSESLHILGKFALDGHIDPDLFDIFARKNLDPAQIDAVDETAIPGYRP
jgi:hypothetical protein